MQKLTRYPDTMRMQAIAAFVFVLISWQAQGATQAQIDTARDKAGAWLIQQRLREGRWATARGAAVPVTAQVLLALSAAGVKGIPARNATNWLLNAKPDSVDALARSVLALTS